MPIANIDFIPPAIPGLKFNQTNPTGGTISGSVDAVSAIVDTISYLLHAPTRGIDDLVPLYKFQKEGVNQVAKYLLTYGGALLADDMGLGKTRQAVVTADLIKHSDDDTVLIVCPASVRHQWQAEVKRIDPKAKIANLGPQSKKEYASEWKRYSEGVEWAFVSYNLMAKALEVCRPTTIILDEPQNFLQSRGSTYNKTLWKWRGSIRYKLALTGTPYTTKPAGLWSILFILFGMRFGKARDFDLRYCDGHQGQWGWENKGATHPQELAKRLSFYMVRRMKSDVMKQMPPVTRTIRWIDGTKAATNALLQMDHTINGMLKAQESTLTEKFEEVIDVVHAANKPTIIFTWLKEHCNELANQLTKRKMPAMAVHGDWEAGTRAKMIEQAKANGLHVVTTYGASSTGLDGLQTFSSNAVFHSIYPVPATTLQAIDRLNRIGQTEPVTATFVAMRNSVDELLVDKVINRLDIFGQILGRNIATAYLQDALRTNGLDEEKDMDAIFNTLTKG